MVHITKTTQLNLFNTFVTVITSDSTLNSKFNASNILQFEPTSLKHNSLPYIHIPLPNTTSTEEVLNGTLKTKSFQVNMLMLNQYMAKDNILNYANAMINAIESSTSFDTLGYYDVKCDLLNTRTEDRDGQTIIVTEFNINFTGNIE